MVCHNCGKELSENALFCRYCGVPVQSPETAAKASANDTLPTETATMAPADDALPTETVTMAPVNDAEPPKIPAAPAPAADNLPTPEKKRVRRAFARLLLFLIFAGGLTASGWLTFRAWQDWRAPYQTAAFTSLEESLAKAESSAEKLPELDQLLSDNSREIRESLSSVVRYRSLRQEEILNTLTRHTDFNYSALFATEPFSSAYRQYISDLLSAFRQDSLADSWLRPYYIYSAAYGANIGIQEDLWLYAGSDDNKKFNELLSDPAHFYVSRYAAVLTDHLLLNNHLYVTGADMLNTLFAIPGYILDDAVFVKACGGNPNPEEMNVPDWTPQDYSAFWSSAGERSQSDHAVWTDCSLSARDFDIDWNALLDEKAYYRAYEKFMNTIAPGMERYGMAEYVPDDEYFGGVRYELPGKEATLDEIATAYITEHPECLTDLGIDLDALASSYDSLLAEEESRLGELTAAAEDLIFRKNEAVRQRDGRTFLLEQQEKLTALREQHSADASASLRVFAVISLFMFVMTVTGLRWFLRALR